MGGGSELKGAAARALRAAGYKPCPRWWLTQDQLELVEYMAKQNADEVNRIRREANERDEQEWLKRIEVERAWAAMRDGKGST